MKSATYTLRIKNSREIVGVSTVTFGNKNEPTPWLAPLISRFLAAHRHVTIEAELSNRFVDLVGERFDLAVRLGELNDSRLVARKLCARRRLLCAAPAYLERTPIHPHELTARDCLIFSGLPNPRKWEFNREPGDIVRVAVSGPLVSDDAEVLVEAAANGLGILLATDWLVGPALLAGRLVPILAEWKVSDEGAIYLVTPSGTGRTSATRALGEWLIDNLRSPPWTIATSIS